MTARRVQPFAFSVLGGVTFALATPPTDLYPCTVVGLALFAAALGPPGEPANFWPAFRRGAAWGTAAGIVGLRFVPAVIQRFTDLGAPAAYLALVLLAAAQSLVWAIGAGVTSLLRRSARAPFELSFAIGVFVAVSLPAIFAWTPAGLASPWPAFVQLGDLVGEHGVSALFAVGAALLVRAARALVGSGRLVDRFAVARGPALGAVALFVGLAAYGRVRIGRIEAASESLPRVRVALVDPSVDPEARWDPKNFARILATLRSLTHEAEAAGAELTVWPEAAYPFPLSHETPTAPRGARTILDDRVHGPIAFGLITQALPVTVEPGRVELNTYNSAELLMPDGSMQAPSDKLQLLWFGETVPGGDALPWLRRIFQKSGALLPGIEPRALDLPRRLGPSLRMGVLNCYEDTLAAVGRRVDLALAPNLLVNITNDAWFYGTAEPELHARLAAMRAVELRRDLVRAVNMGVASWVDAAGVVRDRRTGRTPATLSVFPTVRDAARTPYARWGDGPLRAAFAIAIAAFALRAQSRRRRSERRADA